MPTGGWISKFAFENNALAADAVGRTAMEDGFIQNAKLDTDAVGATSKIADGIITAAKFTNYANQAGYYGRSTYGDSVYS